MVSSDAVPEQRDQLRWRPFSSSGTQMAEDDGDDDADDDDDCLKWSMMIGSVSTLHHIV